MMKALVLGLLITCSFFHEVGAHPLATKIKRIEIDGREVRESYKVFFLSSGNWIEAERTPTGFLLPNDFSADEYLTVLITFGRHKLDFSRIHISKFSEDWIIGIDKKPFSEEYVTSEEAAVTKSVHYIKFEGTGLATQLVVKEKKSN